jgi:hypothetical protein
LESRLSKSGCNPHKSAVSENAKAWADLRLQFEFKRPLGHAGIANLSIAELAGVVDLLVSEADGRSGNRFRLGIGFRVVRRLDFTRRLRSIILIRQPALGPAGKGRERVGPVEVTRTRRSLLSRLCGPETGKAGMVEGKTRVLPAGFRDPKRWKTAKNVRPPIFQVPKSFGFESCRQK